MRYKAFWVQRARNVLHPKYSAEQRTGKRITMPGYWGRSCLINAPDTPDASGNDSRWSRNRALSPGRGAGQAPAG